MTFVLNQNLYPAHNATNVGSAIYDLQRWDFQSGNNSRGEDERYEGISREGNKGVET
jgi:hypothetical protein